VIFSKGSEGESQVTRRQTRFFQKVVKGGHKSQEDKHDQNNNDTAIERQGQKIKQGQK
jgi:hypothetical protein